MRQHGDRHHQPSISGVHLFRAARDLGLDIPVLLIHANLIVESVVRAVAHPWSPTDAGGGRGRQGTDARLLGAQGQCGGLDELALLMEALVGTGE